MDMSGEYRAVRDYPETGRHEILYDGKPIPHVPYHESSEDDFTWGYGGAGPTNVARSILEHASDLASGEIDVDPAAHQLDFRGEYISPQDSSEGGWAISHSEVVEYLRSREEQ